MTRTQPDARLGSLTFLVFGLLSALGPISVDFYLPAFPALRDDLHTTDGMVQLTLAGMTAGMAAGNLLLGAWSDRAGRRLPLLLSALLHLCATIGCGLAPSVGVLAAMRILQGVGAAGSSVIVIAAIRDVHEGRHLVTALSRVILVATTAPLIAPAAGAELLPYVGWRGIFGVLAIASALVLLAAFLVVPETRSVAARAPGLRARLSEVRSDRGFWAATLAGSMTYGGVYAYVAASPLLLQGVHGVSARAYAVMFLLCSLGLMAGVQAGSWLANRLPAARVLTGFAVVMAASAAGLALQHGEPAGPVGTVLCLWLFATGAGGCFPCAAALALAGQGTQSGTATSVYGFTTFAVAAAVSPIAGAAGLTDATPLAGVLSVTSGTCLLGAWLCTRSAGRSGVQPPHSRG
jgi:DHA1 family bicyclomycin/chloramphenicol resistance-like MFS transporter